MDGGLSAAGSIVSLVAIAGQLIQSTKSLYEFWSSVKEIPTRLQWLREDLKVIQGIIEQISVQSSSARGTTVACHALQNCAIHLNNLKVLVAPLQRRSTKSRKKEIWKSVKAAFNAEKIKLYRENLEAAKLTLVLAQNSLTQGSVLALESGMTKLLASQSNAMCKVDTEHESVHRLISGSQQDIQMTPSSLPLMDRETLTPLLTTTLEKTLSPILEKKLMECLSEFGAALPTRHEPRELHSQRDQKKEIDRESLTRSGAPENSRVYRQRLSMVKRRKRVFWRHFRTLFGYVYFYCDIVSQNWTTMPLHDEDWVYEFRFAFLPRPSLSRRASFISGTWAPSPDCSLTALNFQFRPLLDSGSPIFKACKAGDIDTMKYLFQTKQASPHVIDLDGNDLLLHALDAPWSTRYETCKFLLDVGCQVTMTPAECFNPLDSVMLSGHEGTGSEAEVVDSDLDVMRLLVEIGRLEQVNLCSLVYGVLWRFLLGYYNFPALEYLCKQEFFDFNLRDVLDFCVSESHLVIHRDQLPFVLKTLFACGGDAMTASNAKGDPLMVAVLTGYVSVTFKDDGEHLKGFNSAVITFSLLLKHGFNPSTKLFVYGSQGTVSYIADAVDPDFTAVAWQHALALNGWGPPSSKSDNKINSDSQARNEGRSENGSVSGSEDDKHGEKGHKTNGKSEGVTLGVKEEDTAEVSEEIQSVPGAWVAEQPDPEPDLPEIPVVREFHLSPEDFTGTIRGVEWDSSLYIRS